MRRRNQRGNTILEFTLAGIPILFVWICIVQMGIGMWHYETIQFAVKQTGSYVATHGGTWVSAGNTPATIANAASVFRYWGTGLPAAEVNMTFTAGGQSLSCRLDACLTNATTWPPATANTPGTDVTVKAKYIWYNALAMYAPGPGAGAVNFGAYSLPGYTQQFILF